MVNVVKLVMAAALLLALAGCEKNGDDSDTDGGSKYPGLGPSSCNCKPDEFCIEYFDGLCKPAGSRPQCMFKPSSCKKGDTCKSCGSTLCGPSKCCDDGACNWGYAKTCRPADPSKNYIVCSAQ